MNSYLSRDEFFRQHNAYLRSSRWKEKRIAVLARSAGICELRFTGCTRLASEVDHKTYDNWKQEPLRDLQAVCKTCHRLKTRLDRGNYSYEDSLRAGNRIPIANLRWPNE